MTSQLPNPFSGGGLPFASELLSVPDRLQKKARFWFGDFRGFLFKQNILSLAIGIIIGGATSNVVTKINADVLMPLVNLFFQNQQWKTMGPIISRYRDANGHWVDNRLLVGDLIFTFANLVVIGLICYFLTKLLLKPTPEPPAAPTRSCPFCLENVPLQATKCKFCCSQLPSENTAAPA